jgi:predicted RNase H-like nuclease
MSSPASTTPPYWLAGVDGCPAGWIVALTLLASDNRLARLRFVLCPGFDAVLGLSPAPEIIAVDMPIGLLETPQPGGRACDQLARRLLRRRASSVFSPPSRMVLQATHYDQVRGYGMSRQAFGILPKIRELDDLITPAHQTTVYEAHPELAFMQLAGAPMQHNKKTVAGRTERLKALRRDAVPCYAALPAALQRALHTYPRTRVAYDDLLDACVLLKTSYRLATAQAQRLPATPGLDAKGLRMEICY